MAGLNLIQEYSSDTDDEAENLNDENKEFISDKTARPKLPLPESISSWKGISIHEEVIDDPLEHNGRIRSFKHERGNWATLIYIDYFPSDDLLLWIKSEAVPLVDTGNLFDEFHVSLTRTLILKFHWIDSFVAVIKNIAVGYQSFTAELQNIQVYCNEDATRTFLGITIQSANNSFKNLICDFDKVMTEYELPTFYEDASYHVSFLWCLGDQRKKLETLLPSLTSKLNDFFDNHPEERYVQIDHLKCKIGNKLFSFNLKQYS